MNLPEILQDILDTEDFRAALKLGALALETAIEQYGADGDTGPRTFPHSRQA